MFSVINNHSCVVEQQFSFALGLSTGYKKSCKQAWLLASVSNVEANSGSDLVQSSFTELFMILKCYIQWWILSYIFMDSSFWWLKCFCSFKKLGCEDFCRRSGLSLRAFLLLHHCFASLAVRRCFIQKAEKEMHWLIKSALLFLI